MHSKVATDYMLELLQVGRHVQNYLAIAVALSTCIAAGVAGANSSRASSTDGWLSSRAAA